MLNIVLGQAKYNVDKLSKDVRRGIQGKLRQGHFPERALPGYLRTYNTHRPHGSHGAPPISRISQTAGSYS